MFGVKHDVEMKIGGGKTIENKGGKKSKQQSYLQREKNFLIFKKSPHNKRENKVNALKKTKTKCR